jgi:hypothetical protein
MTILTLLGLPTLLIVDYILIIVYLMRTANQPDKSFRFSMRSLFLTMTIAAIHLGLIAAFLTAHKP